MAADNMKSKVASGAAWRLAERIGMQLASFVVSVVLARILPVSAFGTIAILNAALLIADVFVTGSLGNCLVQKLNADDLDFDTIFWTNIGISVVVYAIMFFTAPQVESFFEYEQLADYMRVIALSVPIVAVNAIQQAYVEHHLIYKKFFLASMMGTVLSGIIGVWCACRGFGVWSLVVQRLSDLTIDTIVLGFTIGLKIRPRFSIERLKGMYGFGTKLMVSNFADTLFSSLRSIIIGDKYTESDLALYTKANQYPNLIVSNLNATISGVLFPVTSKFQQDVDMMKKLLKRSIQTSTFIVFPAMAGMAAIADTFVPLLLTEKWNGCIPYLQIACLDYAMVPLQMANHSTVMAAGKSGVILRNNIIKKTISLALLLVAMNHGVFAIALAVAASSFVALIVNAIPSGKLIGYGLGEQMKDVLGTLVISLVMGAGVYLLGMLPLPRLLLFVIQLAFGVGSYWLMSAIFRVQAYTYTKNLLLGMLRRRTGQQEANER